METIRRNDAGSAVEDVQRRLRVLGHSVQVDGVYGEETCRAVREFRDVEGLPQDDSVDDRTWSALVDASFSMGDRILYLRMPYFHGGDVRKLQSILEVLGFITGGPDGIFGAHTERALREFQSSVGIDDDGIAGSTTYDAIARLRHAWEGKSPTTAHQLKEHMGFARAAEVLESIEACFYGLDEGGCAIASRMANLAWATTPSASVTSADMLEDEPSAATLRIGVSSIHADISDGVPVIEFADDSGFAARLGTAIASASRDDPRVIVEVPASMVAPGEDPARQQRWEQHYAVLLLDAFCSALC